MFKDKKIVLGVTGGIAAYKAAGLASYLSQAGANVQVVMTENAHEFITPLTFQALTGNDVLTSVFDERFPKKIAHIHLADNADLIVVAPATANVIAKMANGLADDMLLNLLLAVPDQNKVLICPAMNVHMYTHQATQKNLETIKSFGLHVLDPASGHLACGYDAVGKLPSTEVIVEKMKEMLT
jgi:phosphopantothenoylcysteine decarboxylase/phosphopantothenate--cysteine ligase